MTNNDPPAGNDRPARINARSAVSAARNAVLTGDETWSSLADGPRVLRASRQRDSAISGSSTEMNDVTRRTSKPALSSFVT
ncbi:MAG TPA: hypothetical protein VNJ03_17220, partial [Vicinamibacterales bacterium]|nr:hypothetical protein [Vicinamibacterales bacterium]